MAGRWSPAASCRATGDSATLTSRTRRGIPTGTRRRPQFTAAALCPVRCQSDDASGRPRKTFLTDVCPILILGCFDKKYKQGLSALPDIARHGGNDDTWIAERVHFYRGRHRAERPRGAPRVLPCALSPVPPFAGGGTGER